MQKTDDNISWAIETLMKMGNLRNFPKEDGQLLLTARAFLNIVDDDAPKQEEIDPRDQPPPVYFEYKAYTAQETVEWLLDALMLENDGNFPSMMLMRETYEKGRACRWGDKEEAERIRKARG